MQVALAFDLVQRQLVRGRIDNAAAPVAPAKDSPQSYR
jgi:hypothetical protein